MEEVRLNKYFSEVGYCSRRQADALIAEGRVSVNGVTAISGVKVTDEDTILVDGLPVGKRLEEVRPVMLAFYKPRGLVCSREGQGAQTVEEYLGLPYRVFSVGRLDKESEGLLLLTNQGALANDIAKARYHHEKEYVVSINQPVTDEFLTRMRGGIQLEEALTRPCKAWKTGEKSFHIVLTQGLNRQIRRMCEACGVRVTRLKRIRVLNVKLGSLEAGAYRELTEEELSQLKQLVYEKQEKQT
jgi:pseudouridine synthase